MCLYSTVDVTVHTSYILVTLCSKNSVFCVCVIFARFNLDNVLLLQWNSCGKRLCRSPFSDVGKLVLGERTSSSHVSPLQRCDNSVSLNTTYRREQSFLLTEDYFLFVPEYSKNPQVRTCFLRTCWVKIGQLGPLFHWVRTYLASYVKQVLILKKILYTWANKISQHSESSLEVPYHLFI